MTAQFWLGLLALPLLAVALLAVWLLYGLVLRAWEKLHMKFAYSVDLDKDLREFGDTEDTPDTYERSANRFRDKLLQSPRLYGFYGLGWCLFLVRDVRKDPEY